jgi:hypothetical protein
MGSPDAVEGERYFDSLESDVPLTSCFPASFAYVPPGRPSRWSVTSTGNPQVQILHRSTDVPAAPSLLAATVESERYFDWHSGFDSRR